MECSSIASGIGYRAKTEKEPEEYNTVRSINMLGFFYPSTPAEMIGSWNMRTQYWLKYYVMVRQLDRTKPRKSGTNTKPIFITFLVAAAWHGFNFGFYGCAFTLMMMDLMWKFMSPTKLAHTISSLLPAFLDRVLKVILMQMILSYSVISLNFLLFETSFKAYSEIYFFWHFFMVFVMLAAMLLPKATGKAAAKTKPESVKKTQ